MSKLYRVSLASKDARAALMKETSKLKDSQEYKDIYISRDLTLAQRNEIKAKRAARPRGHNREANNQRSNGEAINGNRRLSGGNAEPIGTANSSASRTNGATPSAPSSGSATSNFQ